MTMEKCRFYTNSCLCVVSRIACKVNLANSTITSCCANARVVRQMVAAAALFAGAFLPIHAIAADYTRIAAVTDTQPQVHTHDLAVVSIKAPNKVTLSLKKPIAFTTVKVAIQNRSPYTETITDQSTLRNLVNLSMVPQSAGSNCSTPFAELSSKSQSVFPVTLKPNKMLKLVFDVTFTCAVDPLKGSGHEDFQYIAQVDASALDGQEDVDPASDICPRSPLRVVDGAKPDKGCGGKLPGKILGGPVLSDIVKKNNGFGGIFPYQPPQPFLDVTTGNAQMIAATVVQAIEQVLELAAKIGGQVFPGPPSAPDMLSSNSKFELIVTAEQTEQNVSDTCGVSAFVGVGETNYKDNNRKSLSNGDQYGVNYDACDDGDGYILDGSFRLTVNKLQGDPRTDVFQLGYVIYIDELTITSDRDAYAAARILLEWNSLAFPKIVLTASPGELDLSTPADSYNWYGAAQTGEHYLTVNADISIPATQVDARASLMKSDVLGGLVSYVIIVPLQASDGQDPESGEILVSGGSGNGTVRIVIESATSVRLEIDADGDGTVDDYQYTTWVVLRG